jgi:hypothetical protein
MNTRLLVSIAVPATVFVATLAYLVWQGRGEPTMPADTARITAIADPAPPAPQHPPATVPQSLPMAANPAVSASDDPATHRTSAGLRAVTDHHDAGAGTHDPDLPVLFSAVGRSGPDGFLATLVNLSAEQLDVQVTGVSAKTLLRTTIDQSLRPHERRNLTQAGLHVVAGDQVIIQAPSYNDLKVQVQ